ncbi:MAG: Asp-tRNA(Asn)/Glu-tRNA(Gln) amidotransferase subunit GatC [Tissierellia bacterium]|nr:Asp-tRNA(Asn)/Glu-tRNA(Gln) amidotransferase subunit GatC [Tissierellia bacterium]
MITKEQLKSIYKDAHISLDEKELDELTEKFSSLIEFNEILLKADTDGVEPTEINTDNAMYLREDKARDGLDREEALSFANDREYGYFRLQRVID